MYKCLLFVGLIACQNAQLQTVKSVTKKDGVYIVTTDKKRTVITKNEYKINDKILLK